MTKAEMIGEIAKKTNFTKLDVRFVVNTMEEVIAEQLKNHEEVRMLNWLTLYTSTRKEYMGRDPSTGGMIPFPKKTFIRAKFGKKIKDQVL